MWKFITGQNLNGAHDSLIDARAQTDIEIHNFFKPFINTKEAIRLVEDIFSASERSAIIKKLLARYMHPGLS